MRSSSRMSLFVRIFLIIVMFAGYAAIAPQSAGADAIDGKEAASSDQDCVPGQGWMWTPGPSLPDVAAQVQKQLSAKGIAAEVQAKGYGEIDRCGTYRPWGVDFTVRLSNTIHNKQASQQTLADAILPVLQEHGQPHLGNVKLINANGSEIPLEPTGTETALQSAATPEGMDAGEPITKNVYVIVYDPILSNGQRLSQRLGWSSHATITQQTIALFRQATGNRLNYVITNTTVVPSWPALVDGFQYNETQYLAVIANASLHHEPTGVDYNKIVNDPQFDLCGKANRGEIDEVWIYNGPWFGFLGVHARRSGGVCQYNSSPVPGPHNCNRLLPIMGPSPERSVNEAVHNFTHRSEATMSQVYGGWQENDTSTSWNKFGLVKAQSPNYSYSGCGSSHYPPNATSDYSYTDPASVLSNCDDFFNYPNLSNPLTVARSTSCTAWNCQELNYYSYWFGHFPSFPGCGPDNVANDWWKYLLSPGYALYPSLGCQATHMISGNVGTGNVTLSYTDGTAKTVTSDPSGNYFLIVSDNWSGTLTPSKVAFTFTPSSRSFSGVLSEQYNQDFTPQGITRYYVNGATGNNGNSCITPAAPCRNIQEAINKANAGNTVYVTSGTYTFSTNPIPNVVVIDKDLTLSGGWSSDFSAQTGASTIDGGTANNGILAISGTVVVENFIVQNSVSYNGGGIYIVNGNFSLKKSTLRNNAATVNGAGIFLDNGALTVVNSTISGNNAGTSGGGIYASNSFSSSVTVLNSTIAYNNASTGSGIRHTKGSFSLTNTIVGNNTATSSPDCAGTLSQASYSLIENMTGCSIVSGSNNLNVDPQIDSNLTGVMLVHALFSGSPAINAGTASDCPDTDQRGVSRPQGGLCDMGAYEKVQSFVDVPITHPYYNDIEILYANGLTGGCQTSPLKFCPDQIMNRGQAAVFMLRGNFGSSYGPPVATHIFKDDWSKGAWAEPWAEGMKLEGLSAGCLANPLKYCPWDQIPREQAVIFVLRMKYGMNYVPPAATGTLFADMTNPGYFATSWAEQAYKDKLIASCGTSGGKPKFCPKNLVSRGLAAQMIVRAKNLSMP